jgi:hypothetical protein
MTEEHSAFGKTLRAGMRRVPVILIGQPCISPRRSGH